MDPSNAPVITQLDFVSPGEVTPFLRLTDPDIVNILLEESGLLQILYKNLDPSVNLNNTLKVSVTQDEVPPVVRQMLLRRELIPGIAGSIRFHLPNSNTNTELTPTEFERSLFIFSTFFDLPAITQYKLFGRYVSFLPPPTQLAKNTINARVYRRKRVKEAGGDAFHARLYGRRLNSRLTNQELQMQGRVGTTMGRNRARAQRTLNAIRADLAEARRLDAIRNSIWYTTQNTPETNAMTNDEYKTYLRFLRGGTRKRRTLIRRRKSKTHRH